ncbi:porin [Labrys neptuniae]
MFRTISTAIAVFAFTAPGFAGEKTDPRCSQYGEGFVYSADTGMCIRVGGEFRADYGFRKQSGLGQQSGFGSSVKGHVDARGNTDLGPFRIVVEPTARKF